MNDNKSQAIVIRSSSLRTPTSISRVSICGQLVDTSPVMRGLRFTRTGDIANRLWQCDTSRHKRSSPAPSGNGSAVCSSNCHANPAGRPAVHDDNTAAITLAACQKVYRIQATCTRAQGCIRRHARVSRGTATPARTSLRSAGGLHLEVPIVNLERFGRRAFACAGPTLWNKLPRNMRDNGNLAQFKKQLKIFLFYITSFTQRTLYFR